MTKAQDIYDRLMKDGILDATGEINVSFMGIDCRVKSKSVVGDVIQSWLENYLIDRKIKFRKPGNTQNFPDFYLKHGNKQILLEIKSFDGDKSANFDIANFQAYCESLLESPERLDSDYLIFAYGMDAETGKLTFKNIWLKKVWEISSPSEIYPVKVQQKKGMIYTLRPCAWDAKRSRYKAFASRREFIDALEKLINSYPSVNHLKRGKWKAKLLKKYRESTGEEL